MKVEEFLEYESQNNLFNLTIRGVYFWKMTRHFAYKLLTDNLSVSTKTAFANTFWIKIFHLLKIVKSFKYIHFNRRSNAKTYILTSSVFYSDQDNNRLDRIMDHIILREKNSVVIKLFSDDFKPFEFLTYGSLVHHYNHPVRILQNFIMFRIYRFFLINDLDLKNYEKILLWLDVKSLDLKNQIVRDVISFIIEEKRAIKYFKYHRPNLLYLSCGYGREAFISAAHKCGVRVVEIQHGGINRNLLGYNYPIRDFIPYFPNKLVLFGKFWKDEASFPKNTEIKIENHPFYSDNIKRVRQLRKYPFTYDIALFFGHTIPFEYLSKLFEENKRLRILLKPHPLTTLEHRLLINSFRQEFPNVTVSDEHYNYYNIFIRTKIVVTISSTIMYEASACGVPVYIIKMQDYESNLDFIDKYQLKLVNQDYQFMSEEQENFMDYVDGIFN